MAASPAAYGCDLLGRGAYHQRSMPGEVGRMAPSPPAPLPWGEGSTPARDTLLRWPHHSGCWLKPTHSCASSLRSPAGARGGGYQRSIRGKVGRVAPSPPAPIPQGEGGTPACYTLARWPQHAGGWPKPTHSCAPLLLSPAGRGEHTSATPYRLGHSMQAEGWPQRATPPSTLPTAAHHHSPLPRGEGPGVRACGQRLPARKRPSARCVAAARCGCSR